MNELDAFKRFWALVVVGALFMVAVAALTVIDHQRLSQQIAAQAQQRRQEAYVQCVDDNATRKRALAVIEHYKVVDHLPSSTVVPFITIVDAALPNTNCSTLQGNG